MVDLKILTQRITPDMVHIFWLFCLWEHAVKLKKGSLLTYISEKETFTFGSYQITLTKTLSLYYGHNQIENIFGQKRWKKSKNKTCEFCFFFWNIWWLTSFVIQYYNIRMAPISNVINDDEGEWKMKIIFKGIASISQSITKSHCWWYRFQFFFWINFSGF